MQPEPDRGTLGPVRRLLAGTATIVAALVWTHSLAGILRHLGPEDAPPAAWPLTLVTVAVAVLGAASWGSRFSRLVPVAAALAGTVLQLASPGTWAASLALIPAGAAASVLGSRLAARIPADVEGLHRRRPKAAVLWLLLAAVAVLQVGRLSTFMTDPETDWFLSTRHPFWADHECLPAYLYGAELSARGVENVYDPAHYPGLDPDAEPRTAIVGMTPEDPFQYAPQFLLLPRFALLLSHDYPTLRLAWFGIQTTFFLFVAAWLAVWVGGREGRLAAFLLPLALAAFPTLHALQYGQFHLAAVASGVGALLAFHSRRPAMGGALLAVATLSKLFPGLLFVVLAAGRRWRDLAWSAGFCAAITVLALGVLGPAPFAAFVEDHLPRLASGSAFSFGEAWPEIRELVIADNQGVFGLVEKAREMGMPGLGPEAPRRAGRLFVIAAVLLAGWFGLREKRLPRHLRAASWLALLGLGSLASTGAFGDYVPLAATWMLTFLAGRLLRGWRVAVPLALCWVLQFFLLGTSPIGSWFSAPLLIPVSALSAVALLGLYGWVLTDAPQSASAEAREAPPEAAIEQPSRQAA